MCQFFLHNYLCVQIQMCTNKILLYKSVDCVVGVNVAYTGQMYCH